MSSTARPLIDPGSIPPPADTDLVRVYVWEWPVRLAHWLIVISIFFLSWTGLYIGHPFLISAGEARQHFLMGTAKVIHSYASIVFAMAVLVRVIWMFTGNRFSRWNKFLPATRRRRRALGPVLRYYLFMLRKPPGFVGHNPLAGLTYSVVFLLFFTMIGTGIALRTVGASIHSPLRVFAFLVPLFGGPQAARWIHHVGMWLLWGFAVHHVYSAILMSQVEANATIESIFSGYKFVHRDDVIYSGYRFLPHKDERHG
jgi:Ni/Fe-hydrogenase 1 B-type cytochrome subunit